MPQLKILSSNWLVVGLVPGASLVGAVIFVLILCFPSRLLGLEPREPPRPPVLDVQKDKGGKGHGDDGGEQDGHG